MASWPASVHVFDDDQRAALHAAASTGRPLLVRGEPGTGKSQLAHAAAVALRRRLIAFVVDSRTEPSDLLWRYDAVARLADAQLGDKAMVDGRPAALEPALYLGPGPLWWAFDWNQALGASARLRTRLPPPEPLPAGWNWEPRHGCVLLIDEIDKAESELPNALLEALGNGRFAVPMTGTVVSRGQGVPPPLVVVTSNEERELPAAFLRRCYVLTLKLPAAPADLVAHLVRLAAVHRGGFPRLGDDLIEAAARLLVEDRDRAREAGVYVPGLAEYLDLLRALQHCEGEPADRLEQLRGFTLFSSVGL